MLAANTLIISSVGAIVVVAVIFGVLLAVFSKRFAVKVDPRVERVSEILPGANCGGCGEPGCASFAEALGAGRATPAGCVAGGEDIIAEVAKILGVEVEKKEPEVAVVLCKGGTLVNERFIYDGILNCRAAQLLQAGNKSCTYGCLSLGTCAIICPFGAITIKKNGLPKVNEEKCKGCGKCVEVCPRDIIKLVPISKYVHVECMSLDKGGTVKKICETGCIGCKKCEKVCEYDAITIENFLASIDYEKCTSCGECAKECPTGTISNFKLKRESKIKRKEAA